MGWVSVVLGVALLVAGGWRSDSDTHGRTDGRSTGGRGQPPAAGRDERRESGAAGALGVLGILLIVLGIPAIFIHAMAVTVAALILVAGLIGVLATAGTAGFRALRRRRVGITWFAPSASAVLLVTGFVGLGLTVTPPQPAANDVAGARSTHRTHPVSGDSAAVARAPSPTPTADGSAGTRAGGAVAGRAVHRSSPGMGPYPVLRVVDGDTVHVSVRGVDTTLRIIGIDTPETVDPRKPVECFGRAASRKAHALLDGSDVYLRYDPSQGRLDKYGRTLAYVSVRGVDYGKWMIKHGFAHEYTYDLPYQRQAAYQAAEATARRHDAGLWSPRTCAGDTGVDSGLARTSRTTSGGTSGGTTTGGGTSGGDKDCSDFTTQPAAQQYFDSHGGSPSNNVDRLDGDGDGIVCESLPGGTAQGGSGSTGSTGGSGAGTGGSGSTGSGGTDPRFSTCGAAIAAGYGPYVRGQDPEYDWYRDADGDGVVCES